MPVFSGFVKWFTGLIVAFMEKIKIIAGYAVFINKFYKNSRHLRW